MCSLNLVFNLGQEIELLSSSGDFYTISTLQTLMNFNLRVRLWVYFHSTPVERMTLSPSSIWLGKIKLPYFSVLYDAYCAILQQFCSDFSCTGVLYLFKPPLCNCVCSILENESSQPKLVTRKRRRQLLWSHLKDWPAQYKTRGRNKTSS